MLYNFECYSQGDDPCSHCLRNMRYSFSHFLRHNIDRQLFFGGTLNKQSCKLFLERHATMDRLTRRMPAFSQAMHLPLSFDSHHAISTHADRCTMHLSFFEQPYPPQVMQRLSNNSDHNLYHRISRGINSSKIELVGHLAQATLI